MFAPTPSTPVRGRSSSARYNNSGTVASPFSPFTPQSSSSYTELASFSSSHPLPPTFAPSPSSFGTPQRTTAIDSSSSYHDKTNNNNHNHNTPTPSNSTQLQPPHWQQTESRPDEEQHQPQQHQTPQRQQQHPPFQYQRYIPGSVVDGPPSADRTPSASYRAPPAPPAQLAQLQQHQLYANSPGLTGTEASPSIDPSAPLTPRQYQLDLDQGPTTPSPMPLYPSSTPQSYGGGVSGATFVSGLVPMQSSPAAHLATDVPSFPVLDNGLGLKASSVAPISGSNNFHLTAGARPPLRSTLSHNNAIHSSATSATAAATATPVTTSSASGAGGVQASPGNQVLWTRRSAHLPSASSMERSSSTTTTTSRAYPAASFAVAVDADVKPQPSTQPAPTDSTNANPGAPSSLSASAHTHTPAHHSPAPPQPISTNTADTNNNVPPSHTHTHTHTAPSPVSRPHHYHHHADSAPQQQQHSFVLSSAAPQVNGAVGHSVIPAPLHQSSTMHAAPAATGSVVTTSSYHAPSQGGAGVSNALPPIQLAPPSHQTSSPPLVAYNAPITTSIKTDSTTNDNSNTNGDGTVPAAGSVHYANAHYGAPAGPPPVGPHGLITQPGQPGSVVYYQPYAAPPPGYPATWSHHQPHPMSSHYPPFHPYSTHGRLEEPILLPGEMPAPRPPISYAALIGEALLTAPAPHQLYVSEISDSIKNRYSYYRQNPSKVYNGVRHQTSMCKAFVKIPRPFGDQTGGARKWGIRAGCETWFSPGMYCPPPGAAGNSSPASNRGSGGGGGGGRGGGSGGGSRSSGPSKAKSTAQSKRLAIGTSSPRSRPSKRTIHPPAPIEEEIPEPFSPTTNTGGPSVGPAFDGTNARYSPWASAQQAVAQGAPQPQPTAVAQPAAPVPSPPPTTVTDQDTSHWQQPRHSSYGSSQQYAQTAPNSYAYAQPMTSTTTYSSSPSQQHSAYGVSAWGGSYGSGVPPTSSVSYSSAPPGYSHHTHAQAAAIAAGGAPPPPQSNGGYPTPITQPAASPSWRSEPQPRGGAAPAQDSYHYYAQQQQQQQQQLKQEPQQQHGHAQYHHGSSSSHAHAHHHTSSMDGSHDEYDDVYNGRHGAYSPASNGHQGGGRMSPRDRTP